MLRRWETRTGLDRGVRFQETWPWLTVPARLHLFKLVNAFIRDTQDEALGKDFAAVRSAARVSRRSPVRGMREQSNTCLLVERWIRSSVEGTAPARNSLKP
jgi:hypothetical protein